MTIQGAVYELERMLLREDIPDYIKPTIKKIIETVVDEFSDQQVDKEGDELLTPDERANVLNAIDDIRAEIVYTLYIDSLIFGELIDFKNGKISADDVIEEFNRVAKMEVLQIIDKYKAKTESEDDKDE